MKNEWEIFCREYLACDFNGTRAYLAAYPKSSVEAAADSAYKLLRKPELQQHLALLIDARMQRLDIKTDDVLALLWQTVTADANELIEVRRECCRYCYGQDYKYQYTQGEWAAAVEAYARRWEALPANEQILVSPDPNPLGGVGYLKLMPPMPTCPECFGEGEERIVLKDTRDLSPAARQLYAGAKVTNGGVEIKTHSRDKSLELIGRHLAMFTDNVDHKNNGKSFKPMKLADFYDKHPTKPKPGT